MRPWLGVSLLCWVGFVCSGQEFEITAIGKDGTLTWRHPYSGGMFHVEWASSPAGPWFTSWEGLLDLSPDASGVLSMPQPVCYRVGWQPDGTWAGVADTGASSADAHRDRNSGEVEVVPHSSLGKLTWATDTNSTYRVEWAASADGPWYTGWQSLLGLAPPVAGVAVPVHYRVLCTGSCNPSMVYIPAGSFGMGDAFGDGGSEELPVHSVRVRAFLIGRTEVTKALWDEVHGWAVTNDYGFAMAGSGKAPDHPVQYIEWYDMVKWCNACSEREGLTPCYATDAGKATVYKAGRLDVQNDWVRWDANGYRLPTETEWECAARAGAAGRRFPWNDSGSISHSRANYYSSSSDSYDVSSTRGYHPDYDTGDYAWTSPAGSFAPNGYGLYDLAGNVYEWCWDWFDDAYYDSSPTRDPRGPVSGDYRVLRGGGWRSYGRQCRVAYRHDGGRPGDTYNSIGFRLVRTVP